MHVHLRIKCEMEGNCIYTKYRPFLYSVHIINPFTSKNDIGSRFDVRSGNFLFEPHPRFFHKSIIKNLYILISFNLASKWVCIEVETDFVIFFYPILIYIAQQNLTVLFEKKGIETNNFKLVIRRCKSA